MATKKFLDYEGLKTYNGKIKQYADTAASTAAGNVDTNIRTDYKVKDVDTTPGTVALTLDSSTGKVGVTVSSNIVVDADYSTVKANANNSAAAWNTFLGNPSSITKPSPKLSDLATTSAVTSAIATAKGEAIAKAGELDTALKGEITTAYQGADDTVKSTLIGTKDQAGDTIWGAKKYADEKAATAKAAADTAKAAADAAQSTADTAKANAATAQTAAENADAKAVAAQNAANTLKNNTIPNLESSLTTKITDNTNLINTTKDALIGGSTDTKDSNSIKGAKLYAKDLTDNITTRIDSIVSGGVAFKGVVSAMPSNPKNGDLIIIGKEGGIKVGDITYKKDYEDSYSAGAWYELGDSDKNAKAIAAVESKANTNASAIQRVETEYKAADSNLSSAINTVSNAAVKKITGGKSSYVTVTAGTKDSSGNVTLTVTDSIGATFDTISNVNSKISTAKSDLIGNDKNGSDANTIYGAKAHATSLVNTSENSLAAITTDEINKLFA